MYDVNLGKYFYYFQLSRNGKLTAAAINVHDSITRTMVNNYYCQKESIIDVLKVIKKDLGLYF